ncbi:MAG: MraY family glycosyltransferase [Planctomycetota bacterium]
MSPTIVLILVAGMLAGLWTWLALFPIRAHARRLGLLDRPGGHSSHDTPTPLGGGLGIFAGLLATIVLATIAAGMLRTGVPAWLTRLPPDLVQAAATHAPGVWSRMDDVWWLMAACAVLVATGLIDDRVGLPVTLRLGIQFGIAAATVWGLNIELTAYVQLPWLTKWLSVIWIVTVINSFNMLDNMDTLSSGVAAIIAASMAAVMFTTPDPGTARPQLLVAGLLIVVTGSLVGFLFHNRPPAKIFMGDGGSYLVGYLISVSMLMATYAGTSGSSWRPHAVLAPLCAMAVPLYDMTTVLWIRIREGRSPFQGDHSHLSHRLVELGLSRTGAVATIHLVTITCGLSALLLTHVSVLQALTVLGIVACMLMLLAILESTAWRRTS